MLRSVFCLSLGMLVSAVAAGESQQTSRPITEADAVLAVYREDWGLASRGGPAIILAAWPDGLVIWSADRLQGGAPYRSGRIAPEKVASLLARFDQEGLFVDEKLNQAHFGPDSEFITILVKSGKRQLKMQSWHELFEASGKMVVDHAGVSALQGRRRLDVLRRSPADYLFFRFVWSETRTKLSDLVPLQSSAIAGAPVMRGGVLSWQEPAVQ